MLVDRNNGHVGRFRGVLLRAIHPPGGLCYAQDQSSRQRCAFERGPAAFGRRYSMSMILQLPGSLLPGKPSPEGMFFFFGCVTHPEETKTDAQFY